MEYSIHFEDKKEQVAPEETLLTQPLGSLLFAFLETDWSALLEEAKSLLQSVETIADAHFLTAAWYQATHAQYSAAHPYFGLVLEDALMNAMLSCDGVAGSLADSAAAFFASYPDPPMSQAQYDALFPGTEGDDLLLDIAYQFLHLVCGRLQVYTKCRTALAGVVAYALDDAGLNASTLSPLQRRYLMEVERYPALVYLKHYHQLAMVRPRLLLPEQATPHTPQRSSPALLTQLSGLALRQRDFYVAGDLPPLLLLTVEALCARDGVLRRCKTCGRYFLPFSKASLYCDRLIEGEGKTCKQVSAMRAHQEKVQKDDFKLIFRRMNNAYQMRCHRSPDNYPRAEYEAWKERSYALLREAEAGRLTREAFEAQIRLPEPASARAKAED